MKELEAITLSRRLHHDGSPVMRWMISNVVAHRDAKDNIYPRKERPENKIDGVVATIMALARAMLDDDPYAGASGFKTL
jgi:phage terminase large subunit-like protein